MSVNLSRLGRSVVKKVPSMEEVSLDKVWSDQPVVITFFRRFGCLFCRQTAKDLSSIAPLLEAHGVKNVGIGLEPLGLEDFLAGNFFNGDLYVDIEKKTYKEMGYKRYGYFSIFWDFFSKPTMDRARENKSKENLPYDFKGDGFQQGGTLIVSKGGTEVLYDYRQDHLADEVDVKEILKALKITDTRESS